MNCELVRCGLGTGGASGGDGVIGIVGSRELQGECMGCDRGVVFHGASSATERLNPDGKVTGANALNHCVDVIRRAGG